MTAGNCVLAHRRDPDRQRRAAPNALICRGCYRDLETILVGEDTFRDGARTRVPSLAELWLELAEILPAGGTSHGVAVSGSRSAALPFQPLVSTHMAAIRDQLCAWAQLHREDRGEHGPVNTDPHIVADWLALRLDWAVTQDWISDYAGELRELRGRARALLFPERRSIIPLAWCVGTEAGEECDGVLSAVLYDEGVDIDGAIVCDSCGVSWPAWRWHELKRKIRAKATEGAA